jgi:hypothetical protein
MFNLDSQPIEKKISWIFLLALLFVACKSRGNMERDAEIRVSLEASEPDKERYAKFFETLQTCLKAGVKDENCQRNLKPAVILPLRMEKASQNKLAAAFGSPKEVKCTALDNDGQGACKLTLERIVDTSNDLEVDLINEDAASLIFSGKTLGIQMMLVNEGNEGFGIYICRIDGVKAYKTLVSAPLVRGRFKFDTAGKLRDEEGAVKVWLSPSDDKSSAFYEPVEDCFTGSRRYYKED